MKVSTSTSPHLASVLCTSQTPMECIEDGSHNQMLCVFLIVVVVVVVVVVRYTVLIVSLVTTMGFCIAGCHF